MCVRAFSRCVQSIGEVFVISEIIPWHPHGVVCGYIVRMGPHYFSGLTGWSGLRMCCGCEGLPLPSPLVPPCLDASSLILCVGLSLLLSVLRGCPGISLSCKVVPVYIGFSWQVFGMDRVAGVACVRGCIMV